tara:strand:- start:3087 stop:4049 length:963 start_codon:yes stop_codon:yes gene_type:complete
VLALAAPGWAGAQATGPVPDIQACVQQLVIQSEYRSASVTDLYARCERQRSSDAVRTDTSSITDDPGSSAVVVPATDLTRFFRPYKDNYIVFGRARTADGSPPFSGEQLDTKFELGLTFNLFQEITNLTFMSPLAFGYSQRSWWDISEDSQPFAEHNYNPEVFWRFDQPSRPLAGKFPFIDIIGIEHQSNGLPGAGSRSWDRAYVQREFDLLPSLSVDVKLWNVLGAEDTNSDIKDYLGSGEVTFKFSPNDRTQLRLKLLKGDAVEKYSYQLDISYRRPWVNSAFFISYYEGYGEALISYNQKTRSLRAGLYFPLEVLSR